MPHSRETPPSAAVPSPGAQDRDAAAGELRRRHHRAVFSYALVCSRDTETAESLTAAAFARTLDAHRTSSGRDAPWRPRLLRAVLRTAAERAATARRDALSADFVQWYDHATEDMEATTGEERILRLEERSRLFRAFHSLPDRLRTALWHTAVENEAGSEVAALLGVSTGRVAALVTRAREELRQAYLAAHVDSDSATNQCRTYASLLEAASRGTGRRGNSELEHHLRECPGCSSALTELVDLDERLNTELATGVLLWGGSAYVAARIAESATTPAEDVDDHMHGGEDQRRARAMKLLVPGGMVAGAAAAAIGLSLLLLPDSPLDDGPGPGALPTREEKPPATVTRKPPPATRTATPSQPPQRPGNQASQLPSSPLYLRSDRSLGSPAAGTDSVTLARTSGNHDGTPHLPLTFRISDVSGEYEGGVTRFDLSVDAGKAIGNGQQLRVSYDFTGDGTWDRAETYRYFESDDAPGAEHYTEARGLKSGATGAFRDLANGSVKVEVWDAIGPGASKLSIGDASLLKLPFA